MTRLSIITIITLTLATLFFFVIIEASAGEWVWSPPTTAACGGSLAECIAGVESEFEMDSEINRRILATTNYISYGALQRNTVPCSKKGASYYNCKTGAEANPYQRGCNAITKCRS